MTAFLAAVQFLTIMPPLIRRPFTAAELGRSVAFFPLVGFLLGGVLAGVDRLGEWLRLPVTVASALVLIAWVVATGALHLDGFLDTCDGLFGGRTFEDRLRIMRDEHVGAFAVVGGILLLLMKFVTLSEVPYLQRGAALILAATISRAGMALAVVIFPYARSEGLGRDLKDRAGAKEAVLAGIGAALISVILAPVRGLAIMIVAGLAAWVLGRLVLTRLPGLTGDIYGAICELLEVLALVAFVVAGAGV